MKGYMYKEERKEQGLNIFLGVINLHYNVTPNDNI